jgi:hypothetical protein
MSLTKGDSHPVQAEKALYYPIPWKKCSGRLSSVEHQAVLLDRSHRACGRREGVGPDRRDGEFRDIAELS